MHHRRHAAADLAPPALALTRGLIASDADDTGSDDSG